VEDSLDEDYDSTYPDAMVLDDTSPRESRNLHTWGTPPRALWEGRGQRRGEGAGGGQAAKGGSTWGVPSPEGFPGPCPCRRAGRTSPRKVRARHAPGGTGMMGQVPRGRGWAGGLESGSPCGDSTAAPLQLRQRSHRG